MFSVCQKNLCALLEPVCPELLTINTWQPVLQMTSPFVNEQGMTGEARLLWKPLAAWSLVDQGGGGLLWKEVLFSHSILVLHAPGQPRSVVTDMSHLGELH